MTHEPIYFRLSACQVECKRCVLRLCLPFVLAGPNPRLVCALVLSIALPRAHSTDTSNGRKLAE